MAVMQMQRISICALKENRKAILEKLQALREGRTVGEEVILPVTLVVRSSTRIRK